MSHGDTRKALIVGIVNYPEAPLKGCENDAKAMHRLLSRHEKGDPNFECQLMLSTQDPVTEVKLKDKLQSLFKADCGLALFYFSGHGSFQDGKYSLVAQDYSATNGLIELDFLMDCINSSPAKQVVVILDCCHAGGAGNVAMEGSNIFGNSIAQIREGVAILAATPSDDLAVEFMGMGKFTRAICRGLEGSAMDIVGHVTTASLYAYVDTYFDLWQQRPVFKANVKRLTALRYCQPKVEKKVLRQIPVYFGNSSAKLDLDPSFIPGPGSETKHVKIYRDLVKLKSLGLIECSRGGTLIAEARHKGTCLLSDEGQDIHHLVTINKI